VFRFFGGDVIFGVGLGFLAKVIRPWALPQEKVFYSSFSGAGRFGLFGQGHQALGPTTGKSFLLKF